MTADDDRRLVDEVAVPSLWAFQGVGQNHRTLAGHEAVTELLLVGWAAPSDAVAREAALGPVDAGRAAVFTSGRRTAFLTGRAVVRRLLAELFPGSVAWTVDTTTCPECGAAYGPVGVRGVPALASVAYAEGLVAAAVASTAQASRLGVDVEREGDGSHRPEQVGRLPGVQAVLKAGGHGLRLDPALVRFGPGTGWVEGSPSTYRLQEVDGPPGHLITVAWQPTARHRTPPAL